LEARVAEGCALGPKLPPGAKVLDLGCGLGDTVEILNSMGFDASGVDVLEYWGRDFDKYWEDRPRPTGKHLSKLRLVDCVNYRLPFPEAFFDFALSAQVFEHVFNYEEVFSEIARVLKPGAISVHVFPGPWNLRESHIYVPVPWLCYYKPYLALWALLGKRSPRQMGFGWKETVASNVEQMRFCNYPTQRTLLKHARNAGVRIEFAATKSLLLRTRGKFFRFTSRLPRPWRYLAARIGAMRLQRYMLIYGR
jgi:SAM-dependent methyltransferase